MAIYQVFVNCFTGTAVDIAAIKPHPSYRRVRSLAEVRAMATSLVNVGYFNPIVVIQDAGRCYCLDGHLRMTALRFLSEPQKHSDRVYSIPSQLPVVVAPYTLRDVSVLLELGHYCTTSPPLFQRYFGGAWQ